MPVQVIDKTDQTDPRVYGGVMEADGVLLHHTGSRNEAGDEAWLSQYHPNPVSTNQMVKRDGTIIQIVPNNRVAWHAGASVWDGRPDCNSWMIGIEICNAGTGNEPYTAAQVEAVAQTVAYNCARYKIPDRNVTTHAKVALPAGRKNDPKGFPLEMMWNRIRGIRQAWPFDIPMWACME